MKDNILPDNICPYCYARIFHAVYFGHNCPNRPKYVSGKIEPIKTEQK